MFLRCALLAGTLLGTGCRRNQPVRPPSSSSSLPLAEQRALQDLFNASEDDPRVFVFFSAGCPSCASAAAALQMRLEQLPQPMLVLVVWEPVPVYPNAPPDPRAVELLHDARVHQIWDPDHLVSTALRTAHTPGVGAIPQASLRTDEREDGILYDALVIFPAGERWARTLPEPSFIEGGVEATLPELGKRLDHSLDAEENP